MRKLTLRKETLRQLDGTSLRAVAGGMNLSLQNCPSKFCTTGEECSSFCGGPTNLPSLNSCFTPNTN